MALGTLPTKGLSQTTAHNYQCQCLKFLCFIGFIITLPISNSVSCPGIQQNQSGEETKKGRPKPSRGSYVPMIGSLEVSGVTQDIRPWGGGMRAWWPHSLPGITLLGNVRKRKSATNARLETNPWSPELSAQFEGDETQSPH